MPTAIKLALAAELLLVILKETIVSLGAYLRKRAVTPMGFASSAAALAA